MKSVNIPYIEGVDQLRGVAALLVLLYHGTIFFAAKLGHDGLWLFSPYNPLLTLVFEGHTGVSLFIVLSGFIFTYGTYDWEIDYRAFVKNRILRVYPLYITVLFFAISIKASNFSMAVFIQLLLPLFNLYSVENALMRNNEFLAVFWTTAVEFQFYLVFPFILRFFKNNGMRFLVQLIGIAIVFRGIGLYLPDTIVRDYSYYTIAGRLDQFIFGMITASVFKQSGAKVLSIGASYARFSCAAIIVLVVMFFFNQAGGFPASKDWRVFWPTIEAAMWSGFIYTYLGWYRSLPVLIGSFFATVGKYSYSLYLTHYFVIMALINAIQIRKITGDYILDGILYTVCFAAPICIFFAKLMYETIELPFLSLRGRYILPFRETR